jgi:hypothetical protein
MVKIDLGRGSKVHCRRPARRHRHGDDRVDAGEGTGHDADQRTIAQGRVIAGGPDAGAIGQTSGLPLSGGRRVALRSEGAERLVEQRPLDLPDRVAAEFSSADSPTTKTAGALDFSVFRHALCSVMQRIGKALYGKNPCCGFKSLSLRQG